MKNIKLIVLLIVLMWLMFFISFFLPLNQYGIIPRHLNGLVGIILSPFLHANLAHIIANTISLAIFGFSFAVVESKNFSIIIFKIVLFGGLFTWIFARPAVHLGASGLIFGLFSYLLFIGLFKWKVKYIFISTLTLLFYGAMIFSVLPQVGHVSWESHLAGGCVGFFLAKSR